MKRGFESRRGRQNCRTIAQGIERGATNAETGVRFPLVLPDEQGHGGRAPAKKAESRKIVARESPSSRGLGCDPLTVETRVRIPPGTPEKKDWIFSNKADRIILVGE